MLAPFEFAEQHYAERGQSVELIPFFYGLSFNLSNALTNAIFAQHIEIDRDSDFVWCDVRVVMTSGTPLLQEFYSRQLLDVYIGQTGRRITDVLGGGLFSGVDIGDWTGCADRPYVFFEPIIVPARTVITVQLQSVDSQASHFMDIAFHGMKAAQTPQ